MVGNFDVVPAEVFLSETENNYENMLWCFIRISRHRSHSTSSSGSSSEDSDTDSSDSDSDSSGSDTNNNTKDKKSIKSPLKSPSSSPKVRVLLGENCKIKSQLQSIVGCHLHEYQD